MRILIFTSSVTRTAGGLFDAVREMFTNEAFANHDLKILSFEGDYIEEDVPKWRGIQMRLFSPHAMLYSRQAKRAILEEKADVLHMEGLWRYPHILMGVWKKRRKEPIVCSPHGMLDPYIIKSQGKLKRIISNLFFQNGLDSVDCYHALCQKEYEDIRAYGQRQPIAIIPNGINLPSSDLHFEKTDNCRHLLYLGRLHQKKGVDLLLLALANIKRSQPDLLDGWVVDIVGWDDENCQVTLETIVRDNGLNNIVVFHGGKFGEDKQHMYAIADGYILPSHGEGMPMTVLEAWAWRKPVIMTPKCNIPEGFEAGAALKIEDNVASVTEGLSLFLRMTDAERQAIGDKGCQLVTERFTWDASAAKMLDLYRWLLGESSKPDFVHI